MKKIIALTLVLILAVGLFVKLQEQRQRLCLFPELQAGSRQCMAALAKTYTEKTGVTVKVVTAASGTYETTLTAEMARRTPPRCSSAATRRLWTPGRTTASRSTARSS